MRRAVLPAAAPSPLPLAPNAPPRTAFARGGALLWAALLLGALALRLGRLDWQPLWWDEGYSVYFATEPLPRMLWLTAHDIHPPLYYALLHLWVRVLGSGPVALRLLSVVIGVLGIAALAWLAHVVFPYRARTAWIAALLLAVSPFHLYYAQEVRMYALALLLCTAATAFLWQAVRALLAGLPARRALIGYALAAALALYTLYYAALLLGVQALWAPWLLRTGGAERKPRRTLGPLLLAWAAIAALYAPWLIYALPKLIGYVAQKVTADSDKPLGLLEYLARHARTLLIGHVAPTSALGWAALGLSLAAIVLVLLITTRMGFAAATPRPVRALALFLLAPTAAAFLLNLRLPFFPSGGERLLLFLLPCALLLIARAADSALAARPAAGAAGLAALVLSGLLGAAIFYITPRYSDDDYRPVIAQAVAQGAPGDTFLATFPWMVGYWRAYAPPALAGPQPLLLGDAAVEYSPGVRAALDTALTQGTLWFPEPLGFGSQLPAQIEAHLRQGALNLENRWFSPATRLTAWAQAQAVAAAPLAASFGPDVTLSAGGVQAQPVPGANRPLAARLLWDQVATARDLSVNLRLVDGAQRTWAARAWAPPGSFGAQAQATGAVEETVGLIVPAGTPPGVYTVTVGVSDAAGARSAQTAAGLTPALALGTVTVTLPIAALDPVQMPLTHRIARPPVADGLALLGAALPVTPLLAGTRAALRIAAESRVATAPPRDLYVTLTDAGHVTAADWQGWTLPDLPTWAWAAGTRVLVPVEFDLPPTLAAGRYTISAGWVNRDADSRTTPLRLGTIAVERRAASFAPPAPAQPLDPAPLFGTHALLLGATFTHTADSLTVALDWQVQQPLLPPHHIFVHADAPDGRTLVQSDGPPRTASGPAPSGTWQPGEYLRTLHTLVLPPDAPPLTVRVGLYNPDTLVRLPVAINGAPAGDAVEVTTLP